MPSGVIAAELSSAHVFRCLYDGAVSLWKAACVSNEAACPEMIVVLRSR
jgi:hypothetical protein